MGLFLFLLFKSKQSASYQCPVHGALAWAGRLSTCLEAGTAGVHATSSTSLTPAAQGPLTCEMGLQRGLDCKTSACPQGSESKGRGDTHKELSHQCSASPHFHSRDTQRWANSMACLMGKIARTMSLISLVFSIFHEIMPVGWLGTHLTFFFLPFM